MNDAGGYAWRLDAWDQLDRFLVLGVEGGTYYATEKALTVEQATNVVALLQADGPRVVERVREISEAGRAYKNDPALFALEADRRGDDVERLHHRGPDRPRDAERRRVLTGRSVRGERLHPRDDLVRMAVIMGRPGRPAHRYYANHGTIAFRV